MQWLQTDQMEEINQRIMTENERVELDWTKNLVCSMAEHIVLFYDSCLVNLEISCRLLLICQSRCLCWVL
jgi:hypothetical protein